MESDSGQIRVLVRKDGDFWVAQCLEFDIVAQASDPDQLQLRLMATIEGELEESIRRHGRPFAGIDPAPRFFYDLWERRSKLFKQSQPTVVKNARPINVEFALAAAT